MRLRLSSAAHRDVREAQAWYAERGPQLELAFLEDLDRTLHQIRTFPAGHPVVHRSVRRATFQRFPYSVFYVERRDYLFVLGVVHQARSPERWPGR